MVHFPLIFFYGNHMPFTLYFLQGDTFKVLPFTQPRECCSPELGLRTVELWPLPITYQLCDLSVSLTLCGQIKSFLRPSQLCYSGML